MKKEYYQRPDVKERIRNYQVEYYQKHKEEILQKRKEYDKKYYQENKEYIKISHLKYKERLNERSRKWNESHREHFKKYYQDNKEHIKEYNKKYKKTENGIMTNRKQSHKHNRKKWITILPNIFPKDISIDWHHIDGKIFVAPLPDTLHRRINGRKLDEHINNANEWIEFYYGIHPMDFIMEENKCKDAKIVKDGLKIREQ